MSRSVQEIPDQSPDAGTLADAGTLGTSPEAREGVVVLPAPLRLHHGDMLDPVQVAYRLDGAPHAPVVAVLGGISAHRVVTGPGGWWCQHVGPSCGVDTRRFRVLGIDYLGGHGDSTAPRGGAAFPPVSAFDQAELLHVVQTHLKIPVLHAIVGASYGGMVAMCFAARFPEAVKRIVVVSAADRAQVLSTAWRSVQRQIVREALERGDGAAGLKLARALAMATYRSQSEFETRFNGAPVREGARFRFPVEGYLFARGDDYVQKYRAESFLALSESIDLHAVDATQIRTPTTLIAVREDQLVPFAHVQELAARLSDRAHLIEINSIFGHDAFLKESAVLNPIIQRVLAESFKS